jgi:hypothetical protein
MTSKNKDSKAYKNNRRTDNEKLKLSFKNSKSWGDVLWQTSMTVSL